MRRVLITGMSGTGKSTVIERLRVMGRKAIDTDWDPRWEQPDADGVWVWREEAIDALLNQEDTDVLFVSACVPNQGRFYHRFDAVILLSAPESVTVQRLADRTNNPYGKSHDEISEVLGYKDTVEPQLRKRATAEIDTTISISDVILRILEIAEPHRDPSYDSTKSGD